MTGSELMKWTSRVMMRQIPHREEQEGDWDHPPRKKDGYPGLHVCKGWSLLA